MPDWLVLLFSMILVLLVLNPSPAGYSWWMGRQRPGWMVGYQIWVPLLWLAVLIPLYFSALTSWNVTGSVPLMLAYAVLLLLIKASTLFMCWRRSLAVGAAAGLLGWGYAIALTIALSRRAPDAVPWLLPLLIWTPLESWVIWRMRRLET